jgi:hypothetical protein
MQSMSVFVGPSGSVRPTRGHESVPTHSVRRLHVDNAVQTLENLQRPQMCHAHTVVSGEMLPSMVIGASPLTVHQYRRYVLAW